MIETQLTGGIVTAGGCGGPEKRCTDLEEKWRQTTFLWLINTITFAAAVMHVWSTVGQEMMKTEKQTKAGI